MPVDFQPDRYNVAILAKCTTFTGRWIIFLGQHFDGKVYCYDVGFFCRDDGRVQRLHFKERKEGAYIQYDEAKEVLQKAPAGASEHHADRPEYTIYGPDGKPTSVKFD